MELWELISLELDYPAEEIGKYLKKEYGTKIKRVKKHKKEQDYFKKTQLCRIVNEAVGENLERKLVLFGSGYYHHFTYGLCKYADRISQHYAYIHFDHHHDAWKDDDYEITCGSFVRDILEDTDASAVLFIGSHAPKRILVHGKPQLSIVERHLRKGRKFKKLKWRLAKLPEEVYLSFDLDVMSKSIIKTAYDQGTLKEEELMKCIAIIKDTKYIIGADVFGYGGLYGKARGKELYARIVESLLEA